MPAIINLAPQFVQNLGGPALALAAAVSVLPFRRPIAPMKPAGGGDGASVGRACALPHGLDPAAPLAMPRVGTGAFRPDAADADDADEPAPAPAAFSAEAGALLKRLPSPALPTALMEAFSDAFIGGGATRAVGTAPVRRGGAGSATGASPPPLPPPSDMGGGVGDGLGLDG
jgi:hypothetical protein